MSDHEEQPEKTRGRPFAKGESGNPGGRPKGSRNRLTLKIEELATIKVEAIIEKISQQALSGDSSAQRLFFEKILPKNLERPVNFEMPPLNSAADADAAMQAVLAAVALGELTPAEADKIKTQIEFRVKTLEAKDFEQRLLAIEDLMKS